MKFRDRELPKTPMEATPSSTLSTPPDSATSTYIHSSTPSCLEVEGRPWYRRVDRKKAEELVRKGEGRKNSRMEVWKDGERRAAERRNRAQQVLKRKAKRNEGVAGRKIEERLSH